jgi:hypothetical protein
MATPALDISYQRGPDFFRLLRYNGPNQITLIFHDKAGDIAGTGTAIFRPGYIGGKPTTVGYLGDLRMGHDRRTLIQWRKIIEDMVNYSPSLAETGFCRHFCTAVLQENSKAQAALVRNRRGGFSYKELAQYNITYVLAKSPSPARLMNSLLRQPAYSIGSPDISDLMDFLDEQQRCREYGLQIKSHELAYRFRHWELLSQDDFLAVFDHTGRIIATTAPWSPHHAKTMTIERMPLSLKAIRRIGNSFRRGLRPLPREGETVDTLYLTHLEISADLDPADRKRAFRTLLDAIFDKYLKTPGSRWHMIGFADFCDWPVTSRFDGYLYFREGATLYSVEPPSAKETWAPNNGRRNVAPNFEMALV